MKLSLLMRVGDDRYAIDLDQVVRVAPALTAAPLPFAVSALEGLAAYGRDIVPQMSLCQTVGKTDALSEGDYVVLARTASGILALRHDGFDGVRELPDGRMAPMASPVGDCRTSMIKLAGFRIYGIDARRIRIPGEASLPSVAPLAQRNDDADRHQEPISRVRQRKMLVCEDQGVQVFFDPFLVTRIASTAEGVIVVALLHEGLSANRQVERVMGMVEEDSSSRPEGGIVFAPGSADLADLEWQLADDLKSEEAAENEHESRQPVFQLSAGSTHWAVRTGDVQSIAQVRSWCALDWSKGGADGLVVVSGDVLPAIRLGGASHAGAMCVVVRDGTHAWALVCDNAMDLGSVPSGAQAASSPVSREVVEVDGTPMMVLEPRWLDRWGEAA